MIEVRPLTAETLEVVDRHLPLSRLDQPGGEYLVAWEDGVPVGHLHLDWRPNPPQVQDLFVPEPHRRRGIASQLSGAAEEHVRERGFSRIALDVDVENGSARALYEKLGYRPSGEPRRHAGTVLIRGEPFTFDVMMLDLAKDL